MVQSFRDLRVYRAAFEAQLEIFTVVNTWPRSERFLLVDQVLRSSRSVCVNIAEAWRKRRYPAAFVAKLSDAEGEAEETRVHLQIALACGYMEPSSVDRLDASYDAILAGLSRMSQNPRAWTPRAVPRPRSSTDRTAAEKGRGDRNADAALSPAAKVESPGRESGTRTTPTEEDPQ